MPLCVIEHFISMRNSNNLSPLMLLGIDTLPGPSNIKIAPINTDRLSVRTSKAIWIPCSCLALSFGSDLTVVGISWVEIDVVGTWIEVSELVLLP